MLRKTLLEKRMSFPQHLQIVGSRKIFYHICFAMCDRNLRKPFPLQDVPSDNPIKPSDKCQ